MSQAEKATSQAETNTIKTLLHLNARAIEAHKPADLIFIIINETVHLTPYRQAAFFNINANNNPKLTSASGLVSIEQNSPYTVWLNGFAKTFKGLNTVQKISLADAKAEHQVHWQEWLPEHLLLIPLLEKKSKPLGYVLYARELPWSDSEIEKLSYINNYYSYCLNALTQSRKSIFNGFKKLLSSKGFLLMSACVLALMLIPVRLSVLAPSEVVGLNTFIVASPQEGVIQSFTVKPNSHVKRGDVLFTLDDTSITNSYEVAAKALETAKADALTAQQRAFDDFKSRSDLASVIGRVREKEAELASVQALKSRIEIKAERDGIAIFTDSNEWIGRPVQTGERVMQIANPKNAGLLVWLPVNDAINIELGAPMKLFLNTQPLDPISAQLEETSYQASISPENIVSYRLKGKFNDDHLPRIGLRGTARISGEWSVLGYYLFRRPIAAIREWTGI